MNTYNAIFSFLAIASVLSLLLFTVAFLFSLSNLKDNDKLSEYECGFEPFDQATRQPFDIHFYVVGILFLIFDVEIALLFPWVLGLHNLDPIAVWTMFFVLMLLIVGFIYEWRRGALVWPTPDHSSKTR